MKKLFCYLVSCVAAHAAAQTHTGISADLGLKDPGAIKVIDECFELTASGKPEESLGKLRRFNASHSTNSKEESAALLLMEADALLVKSKNVETAEVKRILERLESSYRDSKAMAMLQRTKKLHQLVDGGSQALQTLEKAATAAEAAESMRIFLQANLAPQAAPEVLFMSQGLLKKWGESPEVIPVIVDALNVLHGNDSEKLAYELAKSAEQHNQFATSTKFLLKHANLSCFVRKFVDASWSLNLLDKMKLSDSDYAEYALFRAIFTRDQGNQKVALEWTALSKRFAEKSHNELITQQIEALVRPGASLDPNPEGVEIPESSNDKVFPIIAVISVVSVYGYKIYLTKRKKNFS